MFNRLCGSVHCIREIKCKITFITCKIVRWKKVNWVSYSMHYSKNDIAVLVEFGGLMGKSVCVQIETNGERCWILDG